MRNEITRCPSCGGELRPVALACTPCGLRIEGNFDVNEFAALSAGDLHLLRILVHTEGHIKEMESALGVSYPTVKARLAELKAKLRPEPKDGPADIQRESADDADTVLRGLESGTITPDEAVRRLRLAQTR